MDRWRRGVDDQLGCIFDNPVAYEEQCSSRRKIDCGNFEHLEECGMKGVDGMQRGKGASKESDYDPTSSGIVQPSRRKLCLDDLNSTAPSGGKLSDSSSSTPLLDDCEIFSDISSCGGGRGDEFVELSLNGSLVCTPLSSPVSSVTSLRSLENWDKPKHEVPELFNIPESRCLSRAESFHSLKAAKDGGGTYFVYPGWSMWSRDHSHSYRSLTPESPLSGEASTKAFPGVKSFKTSLYQHLVAAAGHRYSFPSVNRSASLRSILSSGSSRSWTDMSRNSTKCTCGNGLGEDSKAPLLKRGVKKRWEAVACLRKGLRSLSFVSSHDGSFGFSRVFPLPGCGLSKFDVPSLFFRHKKVLPEKRRKFVTQQQVQTGEKSSTMITGYLQSMSRHGSVSYSFWMDEIDEVLVAKLEQRCIHFYTCRGGSVTRTASSRFRRRINRVVNLVATMSFSFHVFTGVDTKGQVQHFMDSEFSLADHSPAGTKLVTGGTTSTLMRSLWWSRKSSSASTPAAAAAAVNKSKKELAAVVIRMPLEVKKESYGAKVVARSFGNEVEPSESVHVVLPRGEHGGVEGPRPLAERWRSGGVCDCGSWDLGCGIITLSQSIDNVEKNMNNISEEQEVLNLKVEGWKGEVVGMSIGVCISEDGLYRLRYQRPMVALQAFATAVAVLEEKRGEFRRCLLKVEENETKLQVSVIPPNPPVSPIQRL